MQHSLCLTQYLRSTSKNQTCAHSTPSQCLHLVRKKTSVGLNVAVCLGEPLGSHHLLRFSHSVTPLGGGAYLVQSTTQLLHNTFSRHQTLHSRGARELRRARLLPWPLSLSRFPRTEGKCSDQPSQNACCTILTNRHRSCAQNNHRHCCCDGDK